MNFWISFWSWTLLIGLSIFACIGVVVAIGGLGNIFDMFRTLKEQHRRQASEESEKKD